MVDAPQKRSVNLPIVIRSSHSGRRFSCNGSLLIEPLAGERESGAESIEGQLLHFLIASRLVEELGATPPEGGLMSPTLPKSYKLPAFSAWIVDWGVRWVRENIPPDWSLMVEMPIAYRYELPRPVWVPVTEISGPIPDDHEVKDGMVRITYVIISGHKDVFALSPDCTQSHGMDWKTGPVGADPAEENWQLGTYLGLGKRGWPELALSKFSLGQPKIDEEASGIERVTTTELTGPQLDAMNIELAERANRALENRYETDSSARACRWCNVALLRPWNCPSLKGDLKYMKAKIDAGVLEAFRAKPNDAELGDFVIIGRTLAAPVKAATEVLYERLDAVGYVDAGCGNRLTDTTRPGAYEVPDPLALHEKVKELLPDEERRVRASKYSMTDLKNEIAEARGIPKTSKNGESAASLFDAEIRSRGLVVQGTSRILVIT